MRGDMLIPILILITASNARRRLMNENCEQRNCEHKTDSKCIKKDLWNDINEI